MSAAPVNAHLLPTIDATFNLGSATLRWNIGFFSNYIQVPLINSGGDVTLPIRINGANRWIFQNSANGYALTPVSDGGEDLGTTALRVSEAHLLTSVRLGSNPATVGAFRSGNNAYLAFRNVANSANIRVIGVDNFDSVWLSPDGYDVQFGRALVALGGGVAPTLGTIGGTGPAAAAQNAWMRWIDSAGAAFWIPIWK
jgi:hypothetical protein